MVLPQDPSTDLPHAKRVVEVQRAQLEQLLRASAVPRVEAQAHIGEVRRLYVPQRGRFDQIQPPCLLPSPPGRSFQKLLV